VYLYLIVSSRSLLAAFRVQLGGARSRRSLVVALATLIVGVPSRRPLPTRRLATSPERARTPVLPPASRRL